MTRFRSLSRYGELEEQNGAVKVFREKPYVHEGRINGGFFVFEPKVLELIDERRRYP